MSKQKIHVQLKSPFPWKLYNDSLGFMELETMPINHRANNGRAVNDVTRYFMQVKSQKHITSTCSHEEQVFISECFIVHGTQASMAENNGSVCSCTGRC